MKIPELNSSYSESLLYSYNSEMVYTVLENNGKESYNTVARSSTLYKQSVNGYQWANQYRPWPAAGRLQKMTLQRIYINGI